MDTARTHKLHFLAVRQKALTASRLLFDSKCFVFAQWQLKYLFYKTEHKQTLIQITSVIKHFSRKFPTLLRIMAHVVSFKSGFCSSTVLSLGKTVHPPCLQCLCTLVNAWEVPWCNEPNFRRKSKIKIEIIFHFVNISFKRYQISKTGLGSWCLTWAYNGFNGESGDNWCKATIIY